MIITPAAIAYGCLSVLALLLSSGLFLLAGQRLTGPAAQADRGSGFVLVLVLGQAALVARLLAWPALYAMFASYIGLIKGSMCVFGVTQSIPALTRTLEVLEPAAFLVAGATLFVLGAYRAGVAAVDARAVLRHLALAALLSLGASVAGLAFLAAPKQKQEVSCCSVVTDAQTLRGGPYGLLVSREVERAVVPLAHSAALALFLFQAWQLVAPLRRRAMLAGPLSLAHLAVTVVALFGPIAPKLTGMPDHHCGYCLVSPKTAPYGLGFAGLLLLIFSTAAPIWLAWLAYAADTDTASRARFRVLGLIALIAFWALVLVPYYR